jgi:hypothetical protein
VCGQGGGGDQSETRAGQRSELARKDDRFFDAIAGLMISVFLYVRVGQLFFFPISQT